MRIVIFGAGGVGGVIGGRLFEHQRIHGHDITLVARGAHHDAIRDHGLTIHHHAGSVNLAVPVVDAIDRVPLGAGDAVILTMKTQDTPLALDALAAHARDVAVVCAQNGVENERLAIRQFADVYPVCVMLPATFMVPGEVEAHGAPHNAILDVGRSPSGVDPMASALSEAFVASGLDSRPDPAIMRWKYTKLLMNLTNALDALVFDGSVANSLYRRVRAEAEECFTAAGIDHASAVEDRERRRGVMETTEIAGRPRGGGSTWQSFARGARTTEVDWLNGEIVLLGRLHGVPTPVNAMMQAVARDAARRGLAPQSLSVASLEALL